MPAKSRHRTPGEQLLELARQAQEEGLSFDEFWDRAVPPPEALVDRRSGEPKRDAEGEIETKPSRVLPRVGEENPPVGAVLWPNDTRERRDSYHATVAIREHWRRAYEREPDSRSERALRAIRPEAEPDEEGEPGGRSLGAGVPLPA
jgi:hypothetical protein